MGFSILLLSITFSIILLPVQKKLRQVEVRISDNMQRVDNEINKIDRSLKGEERFLNIEKIYKKNDYHPIHSVGLGASFFLLLPVLISSVLLFTQEGILDNVSFLFIKDLSNPDNLLDPINILPLVMFGITFFDAKLRFKNNKKSQIRFLIISIIFFLLVYNLPAGLVLYWIGSNITSFTIEIYKTRSLNL